MVNGIKSNLVSSMYCNDAFKRNLLLVVSLVVFCGSFLKNVLPVMIHCTDFSLELGNNPSDCYKNINILTMSIYILVTT